MPNVKKLNVRNNCCRNQGVDALGALHSAPPVAARAAFESARAQAFAPAPVLT